MFVEYYLMKFHMFTPTPFFNATGPISRSHFD